jgi:N-acetylglutamate synthase-like GNAT family acetyltransferase
MEVYRTLYENDMASLWVRPQEMFHEEVSPGTRRFSEVGVLRIAAPQDLHEILSFGFDTWGNGQTLQEFCASYEQDANHRCGQRYILEAPSGTIVGNVNAIRFSKSVVGFASLSVDPHKRRSGYGTILMRAVMEVLRIENPAMRFLAYSEVNPIFFEKLGFQSLPANQQLYPSAVAVSTGLQPLSEEELLFFRKYF